MGNLSIILACRIPWTEKPTSYSPWGRKESDKTEQLTLSLFSAILVFFPLCSLTMYHKKYIDVISLFKHC